MSPANKPYAIMMHTNLELTYDETKQLLIDEIQGLIHQVKTTDYKDTAAIFLLVKSVVYSVQKLDDEVVSLTGEQKKELTVDVVLWLIYDELKLDIPYIPDAIEKAIFKPLLGMIIDGVVEWMKNRI